MLEDLEGIKKERVIDSIFTLGNAVELGVQIISELRSEDTSSLSDLSLTQVQVSQLLQTKIKEAIADRAIERADSNYLTV